VDALSSILFPSGPVLPVAKFIRALRSESECVRVDRTPHQSVEVLVAFAAVAIDLVLGNGLAVHDTPPASTCVCQSRSSSASLIWAVKAWAGKHDVRGAERHNLSSYAWTLLTLHYLQRSRIIPSLQDPALKSAYAAARGAERARSLRYGRWDVSFVDDCAFVNRWWQTSDLRQPGSESLTVFDLLLGLFDYYAHRWDWLGGVVDIRGAALAEPQAYTHTKGLIRGAFLCETPSSLAT